MASKTDFSEYIRALKRMGFQMEHDSRSKINGRITSLVKQYAQDREVHISLWSRGAHRASHSIRGCSATPLHGAAPHSEFTSLPGMLKAVKHEETRKDNPYYHKFFGNHALWEKYEKDWEDSLQEHAKNVPEGAVGTGSKVRFMANDKYGYDKYEYGIADRMGLNLHTGAVFFYVKLEKDNSICVVPANNIEPAEGWPTDEE